MKIGMIFPGYGSQFVGMGKELYDKSRVVQEYFEEASHCLDINFVKLCFASSDIELSKIIHSYPALFLVSSSVAFATIEAGIKLDWVAGYGVGEYASLCVAGGLNFADGLYLIKKLANFYVTIREQLDIKSVMVNGPSSKRLKQVCEDHSSSTCCAQIAVYENKNEHLVSGHTEAVKSITEALSLNGEGIFKSIETEEGLHTPLLNDLFSQLKVYLTKVDFKDLKIPLITSTAAKEICTAKKVQDVIMGQIIKPIYWTNVIKQFAQFDLLIVPAPSKMLVAELKSYYPKKIIIGIETLADIDNIKKIIDDNKVKAQNNMAEDKPILSETNLV